MRGFATFRGKRGGNGRNLGGPGGSRSAALTTGTARSRNRRNRSQKGWMWPLGTRAAGLWWAQRALPRGTMLDSSGAGSFGVLTRPVGKLEGRMGAAPCQGEAISRSCSSQPWNSGGVMESLGRGRATSLYPRLLQARPGTFQGWRKWLGAAPGQKPISLGVIPFPARYPRNPSRTPEGASAAPSLPFPSLPTAADGWRDPGSNSRESPAHNRATSAMAALQENRPCLEFYLAGKIPAAPPAVLPFPRIGDAGFIPLSGWEFPGNFPFVQ